MTTPKRSRSSSPEPTINEPTTEKDVEASLEKAQEESPDTLSNPPLSAEDEAWLVDPENPRNWPNGKKWRMIGVVSLYTFVSPLASSMMAPALAPIARGYGIRDETIVALTLSIFLLAFALGPLLLGPLSEIYGRTWVLHISNLFFVAFNVGCALAPTTASLIVFRFLAGLAGSSPLAIGAGSCSDLFDEATRAGAMGIFSMGPLIGPVIGPIAGGFLADRLNYHWIFWIITMVSGVASMVGIPVLQETYAPVIRQRRAQRAAKAAGIHLDIHQGLSAGQFLWLNLSRPFVLLSRSIICFMLSLYQSITYGLLYLLFVTFPTVFSKQYGWGPGIAGLAYIGPGLGFLLGVAFGARFMDRTYVSMANNRSGGVGKPEYRLPLAFIGTAFIPIGMLWYGWSADRGVHWIMPIIGSLIFGAGQMFCFLPISVYLVDSFTYAASATAAATLLRSLFGFAFPLFASRLFDSLGVGVACTMLAGLTLAIGGPFPIYLYFRGEQMRKSSSLTR